MINGNIYMLTWKDHKVYKYDTELNIEKEMQYPNIIEEGK